MAHKCVGRNLLRLSVVLILLNSWAVAQNSASFVLGKALTALEQAHAAYEVAKKKCAVASRPLSAGMPRDGETLAINWDFIENGTRELTSKTTVKASKIIDVMHGLRLERNVLLEAAMGCLARQSSPPTVSVTIADAMGALNSASDDVEELLLNRVWDMEADQEMLRKHPQSFCNPAKK